MKLKVINKVPSKPLKNLVKVGLRYYGNKLNQVKTFVKKTSI